MKEFIKKLPYFFLLALYALGTIGGIGYACYNKAYLIAIGVAIVSYMAFYKAKEYFKKFTE